MKIFEKVQLRKTVKLNFSSGYVRILTQKASVNFGGFYFNYI